MPGLQMSRDPQPPASVAYRYYVLTVMAAVYMTNLLDRALIALLLEPIGRDLKLSDSQLGFVSGIAFGLFYAVLGVPIARKADRGNRVNIASVSIGLWSVMVMAVAAVTNYWQLVAARMLAAVGESGCKPPTYSLVGDYFPAPRERLRAMSIYWLGNPLSSLIGFGLGGLIAQAYGWKAAFIVMAIPGALLAVLVRFTVVEPRQALANPSGDRPPMRAVLRRIWDCRSLRHLCCAYILLYTLSLGMAPWYAAFMMRTHHMPMAELGGLLGLIFGIGGIVGVLLGGTIAERFFGDNERVQLRLNAISFALMLPFYIGFLTVSNAYVALAMLFPLVVANGFFMSPSYVLMQRLVTDDMRATTLAVVMLLANLIGFGAGPQIVGILSDVIAPSAGTESLKFALLAMSTIALCAAYHFWISARYVTADLQKMGDEA